jgi:hypothetical protein
VRAAPAPNGAVIANFKARFDKADLDQSAFLDKDELAKVFRGPKAKAPVQGMYDDRGNLSKVYYQAKTKYPELVFLWSADKDADGLVSWLEFKNFELNLLKNQQQQQQALQRMMHSTNRRTTTRSSRPRTVVYRGHRSSRYSTAHRHVQSLQHMQNTQQQQMVRAAQNWQNNMVRMQVAYQTALRQRMLQQQQMINYARQRQAAYYRAVQQHMAAAYRAQARRRR